MFAEWANPCSIACRPQEEGAGLLSLLPGPESREEFVRVPSGALCNVRNVASRAVFSETLKSCLGGWVSCGPVRTTEGEDCST